MASSSSPQIGFVGLGAMGFGMATQLVSSGYTVKGYDVYEPLIKKFVIRGGVAASSLQDAATGSNVLIIMVATAAQVSEALFSNPNGAVHGLSQGSIIILCSTVSPEDVYEFRARIPQQIRFIDSPVSGGAARAANGTLTMLASGAEDDIALARPFLEVMAGKDTLHIIPGKGASGELHEIGNGMKAKTVHQTLAGIHIAMTAEALAFAAVLQLNIPEVVDYVTSTSSPAFSWMFGNRTSHLLSGDKSIHSALNIIVKDMGIVTSVGRKEGVPLFLSSATEQVLNKGVIDGYGLEDDAYLYRIYLSKSQNASQQQSGLPTGPESAKQQSTTHSPHVSIRDVDSNSKLHLIIRMLRAVHLAATAEALNFSDKLGLGGWNLYRIVESAAGASTMFVEAAPVMLDGDHSRQYYKALADQKEEIRIPSIFEAIADLSAVVEEARKTKFPLYLTATALQIFQSVAARGMGEENETAVIKFWN